MSTKKSFIVFAVICLAAFLYAVENTGKINGRVIDLKTGEPLIGANVILKGTVYGSATDLDGNYFISGVPVGVYSLLVSYVGYETLEISAVSVVANDQNKVNITLVSQVMNLNEVVVQASVKANSDIFILAEQMKSDKIQDGVSADQMSRAGDSNAADAVKRITGVSVQDGKYVSVRGLSDRYVSTAMNGVPIPSPEPEKKSIPLDLFTTGILESITAYKTYTPDLPGVFAGGAVNIKTKAYPDSRVFNLKFGLSGKSSFLGADYMTGTIGSFDYFGFDSGIRAVPNEIPENKMLSEWSPLPGYSYSEWKVKLGEYGQSFTSDFSVNSSRIGQPLSLGLNYGNRYVKSNDFEYGFYTNLNFGNSYSYKEELYKRYAVAGDNILARTDISNKKSGYTTNMSLSGSTGFKYLGKHKVKLYGLYTHNSEASLTFGLGRTPNLDENGIYIKEYFVEKSILNFTLTGDHAFEDNISSRLEWAVNAGSSFLNEPDVKSHNYKYISSGDYYEIARSSAKAGQRYYTEGYDRNANIDANYKFSLNDNFGDLYKFKIGNRIQYKDRNFWKRNFYHEYSGSAWPTELIRVDGNDFGAIFADSNFVTSENEEGLILLESTDIASRNAYQATEFITAGYLMADIPLGFNRWRFMNNFRFIGGFRYEYYFLDLIPYNPITGAYYYSPLINNGTTAVEANISEHEILPSLNLQYGMTDDMKFRVSFSKTVARAEFREIAPFEFQAFYGESAIVGYPDLKTTDIYNYDLRYEWHRGAGELIAVGAFYKNFINPIELSQIETADESYLTYQNAHYANTYGIEIDFRNTLPLIDPLKGKIMFIFNTTLSTSEVQTNDMITLFNGVRIRNNSTTLNRPLQGQSDIMANATVSYSDIKGWKAALSYNAFSKRLSALGSGSIPNEYELPFHSLNLTLSKKINKMRVSAKASNLLNSKVRFGVYDLNGEFYASREYAPGLGYSINIQYVF
ncbi:MAG: TonB-dependent receptor [Candidatus Marinimicrobia bacterium]|nr:TonB-dependent receptor [Candidatus Neomarinimicrobiota bacterium]